MRDDFANDAPEKRRGARNRDLHLGPSLAKDGVALVPEAPPNMSMRDVEKNHEARAQKMTEYDVDSQLFHSHHA